MDNLDLENLAMPLIRYDAAGRTVWHNAPAQTMLIAPMEAMLGTSASAIEPFSMQIEHYYKKLHRVLDTAEPGQCELTFDALPKSEKRSFLVRFLPELDENGSVVGAVAVAEEMTQEASAKQNSERV